MHAEEEGKLIALIIRGDHELNEIKAANQPGVASPLVMASPKPNCATPLAPAPVPSAR